MKRRFDSQTKRQAIQAVMETSLHAVSRDRGIDRKSLRAWVRRSKQISELPSKRFRLGGGGRKVSSEQFEDYLSKEIRWLRVRNEKISGSAIIRLAQQTSENFALKLKFSRGWLEKFLSRNDLYVSRSPAQLLDLQEDMARRATQFLQEARKKLESFEAENILAFDELTVLPSSVGSAAALPVEEGASAESKRRIAEGDCSEEEQSPADWPPLLSQLRVTVILCCTASGQRKKPCLLARGSPDAEVSIELLPNATLIRSSDGWISDAVMDRYLLWLAPASLKGPRRLLVVDSASSHHSEATRSLLERLNVELLVIPAMLAPLLQPSDVVYHRLVKSRIQERLDEWFSGQDLQSGLTSRVPRAAPSLGLVASWCVEAWGQCDSEFLSRSFSACLTGDVGELHLAKHDEYGYGFLETWRRSNVESSDV